MEKKIKRIIAREGLVLLGIILLGFIFYFIISNIPDFRAYKNIGGETIKGIVWDDTKSMIESIAIYIIFLGYPVFLLVRFVIWAIKTLKDK